jgi:putative transposase
VRKEKFVQNEYYHIYNRGIDKRDIFSDKYDLERFFKSMKEFNTIEDVISLQKKSIKNKKIELIKKSNESDKFDKSDNLVNFVCYCLNPNHYHFILEQVVNNGISRFMHRVGSGYTRYFNEKYQRSGSLFQGTFKAKHIQKDEYLMWLSVYVNLNFKIHKIDLNNSLYKSSWNEYLRENNESFCKKDIVLAKYNGDIEEFKKDSKYTLIGILNNKNKEREIENFKDGLI